MSGLGKYGKIELLLRTGEDPERDPVLCLRLITERLRHFNPDHDYMAWIGGDTLGAVLTGVALSDLAMERVRWLRWQRHGSVYQTQNVPLPEPSDTEEDDLYVDDKEDDPSPVRTSHQSQRTRPEPLDGRRRTDSRPH